MYQIYGKLRDYDGATDTASVELEGLGHIDFWLDSLPIDAAINRGYLVHGAPVTIAVPDEHRLPEAVVVAVGQQPNTGTIYNGATHQRTQYGHAVIPIGGGGSGYLAVTYPIAFSAAPNSVVVSGDDGHGILLSALSATGFTATASGLTPNSYLQISWHAQGNL